MGRLIRQKAIEQGHRVVAVIDPVSGAREVSAKEFDASSLPLDVIIDFTNPAVLVENVNRYGELKVPAVIGTTGWYDRLNEVAAAVARHGIGLIWAGNFSLGVNLFYQLVRTAGQLFNRFPDYDALIHETHHRHKADSPSGTAEMIGAILLDSLDRKKNLATGNPGRPLQEGELHLSSARGGTIPGIHRVLFDSDVDTIVIEHSARNRSGFADGALLAAEWIIGKKGIYTIDDLMRSIIGER